MSSNSSGRFPGTAFASCPRAVGVAGLEYSDSPVADTHPAGVAERADTYAEFG